MEYTVYKIKEILCVEGFYTTSLGLSTSSTSTSSSSSTSSVSSSSVSVSSSSSSSSRSVSSSSSSSSRSVSSSSSSSSRSVSSSSSSSSSSGVCQQCTSSDYNSASSLAAFPPAGGSHPNFHLLDATSNYCTSPITYNFTVDLSQPANPSQGRYQSGCVEQIFALQNWQTLGEFKIRFNGFDAQDKVRYYNYNFTSGVATPIGNEITIGNGATVDFTINYSTMSAPYPNAIYVNKKQSATDPNPVYKCTQWSVGLVPNSCKPKSSSSSSSSNSISTSSSTSSGSGSTSSSSSSSSSSSNITDSFYTCAVADNPIECVVLNSGLYCAAAGDCNSWGGSEGTANNVSGSRTFVHVLEERFSSFSEIRGVIRQVAADVGACKVRISLRQWDRDGNLKTIFKGWEISSENSASSSSTLYNETGGTGSCGYNIDYEQDQTNAPSRTEISFNRTVDSCSFAGVGSVDRFGWQIEFINCSNSVVQYEFENEGYSICYSFLKTLAQACNQTINILDPNYAGMGGYVGAWAFFNTECCDPATCTGGTTFSCRGNAGSAFPGSTFNWVQYYIEILCTQPPICGEGSLYGCNDVFGGSGDTMNPLCKPYLRNHIWRPLQHTFIDTLGVGLCEVGAWPQHQNQNLCNPIILVFDWERFLTCSSDGNIPQRTERRGAGEANIKWLWDTNRILDKNLNPRSSSAQQLYTKFINQASPYWEMENDLYQEYSTCAAYSCSFASGYQSEGMFYNFWKDPDFNIKYYITFDINYLTTNPHYYDKLRLQQFPLNFNGNGERCKYDNGSYISYANIESNLIYLNDLKESGAGNSAVCKNDFIFYPNAMSNIDTINIDSRCDMGVVIKPTYSFFPWVMNSFRINPDSIRIIEI